MNPTKRKDPMTTVTEPLCPTNAAGHCPHWYDSGETCHYCNEAPHAQEDDGCGELRGELRMARALLWAITVSANPRKLDPDSYLAKDIRVAGTYLARRGLTDPDEMEMWHRITIATLGAEGR